MASSAKVAVVTGSNKGIGFAIVRGLCKQFDGDVYVTARNEDLGKQAVADLNKEGLSPKFHQLDITDESSINRLKSFIQSTYGGLDILVNNAGIAYKQASTAPFAEQAEVTVKTNFWGTLNFCNAMFPLLRPNSRVVNVSSMASQMTIKNCSEQLQQQFRSKDITMDELCKLMQLFVDSAKQGDNKEKGFPNSAYGMSKIGVSVMSFIQQRLLDQGSKKDIVLNACSPGYVATDMTSYKGPKTIDEGADTPLYLALLPPNTTNPKGVFVSDRTVKPL